MFWSRHRFCDTGDTHTFSSIKLDDEEAEEHLTEEKAWNIMKEDIEGWEVILIIISNINFSWT